MELYHRVTINRGFIRLENDSDIGLAHEDLGEIEICLSSVSRLVRNKASCSTSKCGAARKTDRIHEGQKKKGLTHSIQYYKHPSYTTGVYS